MNYLYFQPAYVSKFLCDGSKCDAKCCKQWRIYIDKATCQKYPQDVKAHLRFDDKHGLHLIELDDKNVCPFLNADKLCRLQLKYGENFLSATCATYPRYTYDFGDFFERSLTLTCPVAAEMILFAKEPMQFELVEVSEKIHSQNGKIVKIPVACGEGLSRRMLEAQIAMLSILQERTLTIDQRLIVLGFFMDKLDEISTDGLNEYALLKLIDAYESKKFLAEQVPIMLQIIQFKPRKFIELILRLFNSLYSGTNYKYVRDVADVLQIVPDSNNRASVSQITTNYQRLAAAHNKFLNDYSIVLENYLINELLVNCYPWRFKESIVINYAMFITTYKIFELILFAATLKGLNSKGDLLKLTGWFDTRIVHSLGNDVHKKIFAQIQVELPALMESLLSGLP